jgi:hypothetical protein
MARLTIEPAAWPAMAPTMHVVGYFCAREGERERGAEVV